MVAALPVGIPLTGDRVRLDPLTEADLPQLAPFVRDPAVYAAGYVMFERPSSEAGALALVRRRFLPTVAPDGDGRGRVAYALRLVADSELGEAGTLVGTSSLGEAHAANESIQLGWTLYGPRWWGSAVNPSAKYLLLRHCFEDLGYGRVAIQTDAVNTRSQAAIAKLGARREGVLRRHLRRDDGTFRDTVVFSILRDEWPRVAAGLRARVGGVHASG